MKFETSAAPAPHPPGNAKLFLESVDVVEQPSFSDPNVMQKRVAWKFVSNQVNPETGERFRHTEWTGLKYGNPKAGLTKFANMIMPNLANLAYLKRKGYAKPEDCFEKEFDSDLFIGKKFDASFVAGFKDNGDPKTTLAFITIADAAPVAVAAGGVPSESVDPFADDQPDPFADE